MKMKKFDSQHCAAHILTRNLQVEDPDENRPDPSKSFEIHVDPAHYCPYHTYQGCPELSILKRP